MRTDANDSHVHPFSDSPGAQELTRLFPDSYAARTFNVEPFGENWRSEVRNGSFMLLAAAILVLASIAISDRRRRLAHSASIVVSVGPLQARRSKDARPCVATFVGIEFASS